MLCDACLQLAVICSAGHRIRLDSGSKRAGTTIAGVHELEKAGVRGALMNAVNAAAEKADALAKGT